jgi:hypothetical protein
MLDGGVIDFVLRFELNPADRFTLKLVAGTDSPTHLTWERMK